MANAQPSVTFKPVEWKILPEYYVLATFPDGKKVRISGAFKTKAAAQQWIKTSSAHWLVENSNRKRG